MSTLVFAPVCPLHSLAHCAPLIHTTRCYNSVYAFTNVKNPSPLQHIETSPELYPRIINGDGTIQLIFDEIIGPLDSKYYVPFDVIIRNGAIDLVSEFHRTTNIENHRLVGYTMALSPGGYTFTSTTDDVVITVDRSSVTIRDADEVISQWTHKLATVKGIAAEEVA